MIPEDSSQHIMANGDSGLVDDFTISEDFVQSPTHKAAKTSSIDFDGLLQPALTLHQDLTEGNGGQAWPVISAPTTTTGAQS